MTRKTLALAALIAIGFGCVGFCWSEPVSAQTAWPPYPSDEAAPHDIQRGPGGYFAWYKILLIIVLFWFWIKTTDWMNRDAIRFSKFTNITPEVWNPIVLVLFLIGFVAAISVPMFVVGYAVFAVTSIFPFTIYLVMRRGKIPAEEKSDEPAGFVEEVAQVNVPIKLKPAGDTEEAAQSNMIRARQSPAFEDACQLLYDAGVKRADQVLIDFTRDTVQLRTQIDGLWHPLPNMDRATGDAMLVSLKYLANLNPMDRRQLQQGTIVGEIGRDELAYDVSSQGVQTGERVLVKVSREATLKLELAQLGMWPESVELLRDKMRGGSYVIISAPQGQGLSTTWQAVLNAADRFTSDWVAIVDHDEKETERENIDVNRYDSRQGETPDKLIRSILLRQPNALVVPNPTNAETIDTLSREVVQDNRAVVSRVHAKSTAEAFLKLMAVSKDRQQFVNSVGVVTCQRLVRRLCDSCKQPVQIQPQAVVQMGGDPQEGNTIYNQFKMPPPEQQVDENGKPIQIPVCRTCSGIGFVGRIAVYELLLMDDVIRAEAMKNPKIEHIAAIARKQGNLSVLQQGYKMVLAGVTSMAEVQRVIQQGG